MSSSTVSASILFFGALPSYVLPSLTLKTSVLVLSTWHFLLQIMRPFVIALFAASTLLNASRRCAVLWVGECLSIAFTHFADVMVAGSRSLALQISERWSESSGFRTKEMLNAIILKDCVRNSVLEPILSQRLRWLVAIESQLAASSLSASITVPPPRALVIVRICPM